MADSVLAVATAMLVIADDSPAQSADWHSAVATLRANGIRRMSGTNDNICFKVDRRKSGINGEELYFGAYQSGTTHLETIMPNTYAATVYRSPDAGYALRWSGTGKNIVGEGWQYGWQVTQGAHRNAYFVAERIGPANIAACF